VLTQIKRVGYKNILQIKKLIIILNYNQ